jgi:hypothetical protein
MTGDVVSLWGDVMSTPLGDVTSGDAMFSSPCILHLVNFSGYEVSEWDEGIKLHRIQSQDHRR